jgi:hypothetical protein
MPDASQNISKTEQRVFPRDGGRTAQSKRMMVIYGAVTLLVLVIVNARRAPSDSTALWPLLLASAAFLYLWWFGTMLFDLVFVWHRYIRHDAAMNFLRHRHKHRVQTETDGPDDRPHGSAPAKLPPKSPLSGPVVVRPIERGQSEGAGMTM